ncbi:MAG: V-type ATPase subunit [Treponema sp.]|nr:V-type ATPase subunit [Treponema sp.]
MRLPRSSGPPSLPGARLTPGAGERAYVYAKACGIMGKSFVARRIPELTRPDRLSALDRLVFPRESRELPERELLPDLERRITKRAVSQILSIVSSYSRPPELLLRLLRTWEYADLKSSLNALVGGESSFPSWTGLGPFGTVRFAAYPDLAAMLKGTEFEFLLSREMNLVRGGDAVLAQTLLDKHYYSCLWQAVKKLPVSDRTEAEKIIAEEISLRNCIWALRLRSYYGMPGREVSEHLMDIGPVKRGKSFRKGENVPAPVSLAADARAMLDFSLDSRSAWEGWRRERFLNPEIPGRSWTADPRYFQNATGDYLYKRALRAFRRKPFSVDTAFCFIRIKQYEEDLLTSVAEGLGLGMSGQDVFSLLEVVP